MRLSRGKNCIMKNFKPKVAALTLFAALFVLFGSATANAKPFAKTLSLYGVTFTVKSPNRTSRNTVTITTRGLTRNLKVTKSFDGMVIGAAVGDSNLDQSPELFVWGTSGGSGSYGILIGYGVNNKKSATEIYVPEMDSGADMAKGYMGHDEFEMVENNLVRKFPVYRPGDSNGKATGGTRQFQYKVAAGEAGWILNVDKWYDF